MTADEQGVIRKKGPPGRRFIAVDLDGTIAHYDRWRGRDHIGEPIEENVARVKERMAKGDVVCIFTSRVCDADTPHSVYATIHHWCERVFGERLFVTATKFRYFSEFWDDRAVPMSALVKNA